MSNTLKLRPYSVRLTLSAVSFCGSPAGHLDSVFSGAFGDAWNSGEVAGLRARKINRLTIADREFLTLEMDLVCSADADEIRTRLRMLTDATDVRVRPLPPVRACTLPRRLAA